MKAMVQAFAASDRRIGDCVDSCLDAWGRPRHEAALQPQHQRLRQRRSKPRQALKWLRTAPTSTTKAGVYFKNVKNQHSERSQRGRLHCEHGCDFGGPGLRLRRLSSGAGTDARNFEIDTIHKGYGAKNDRNGGVDQPAEFCRS